MHILVVIGVLAAISVGLLLLALAEMRSAPPSAVARELAQLRRMETGPFRRSHRKLRQARHDRVRHLVESLGERIEARHSEMEGTRRKLVQAGFWSPDAVRIYLGARVVIAVSVAVLVLVVSSLLGARVPLAFLLATFYGGLGWGIPALYVGSHRRKRFGEIQDALADALDLLVACVEAGMGLNQAVVRVAEEIRHVSPALAEELTMVNLEIRAGAPRSQAFANLADRVDLEDIRSFVAMLNQTDAFGTPIGQALRVQSETVRTARRQRAEEAAAKTSIKLLFPLVFCIFPALFVVILTPAVLQFVDAMVVLDQQLSNL